MIRRPICSTGASAIQVPAFQATCAPAITCSPPAWSLCTRPPASWHGISSSPLMMSRTEISAQTPVLADLPIKGVVRKTICWPNRNGFYYVLDRVAGEFLAEAAFVEVMLGEGGPPQPDVQFCRTSARYRPEGVVGSPGIDGGTNWQNPAFEPETGDLSSSLQPRAVRSSPSFLRTESRAGRMASLSAAARAKSSLSELAKSWRSTPLLARENGNTLHPQALLPVTQ